MMTMTEKLDKLIERLSDLSIDLAEAEDKAHDMKILLGQISHQLGNVQSDLESYSMNEVPNEVQQTTFQRSRYTRRVLECDQPFGSRVAVKMSCGHVFSVRAYSRYHHAKTLGCIKCEAGTPVGKDD